MGLPRLRVAVDLPDVVAATTEPGSSSGGHWRCLSVDADGMWLSLTVVRSRRHPDRALVELGADEAAEQIGDDALCVCSYNAERDVTGVRVTALGAPKAPPLWFAEIRESAAHPPAVHLMTFTGHGVREGELLDESRVAEVGVASDDQLGAVRWYPATGEVDQIYVQPQWRRRSVASALTMAGTTLSRARNWPAFWGDGQRTDLGEQWRSAQTWRDRAAPLTHVAPPMTPPPAD